MDRYFLFMDGTFIGLPEKFCSMNAAVKYVNSHPEKYSGVMYLLNRQSFNALTERMNSMLEWIADMDEYERNNGE